ncbi:hypothetical protein ABK040_011877, partial [Willaertia magna]
MAFSLKFFLFFSLFIYSSIELEVLLYPSYEFQLYKPRRQYYYAMGFGFDNEVLNLCDFNFTTSCFNFFCGSNEIVSFNLTNSIVNNSTFREEYFNRFNYCLYCNNNDAKEFQEIIAS